MIGSLAALGLPDDSSDVELDTRTTPTASHPLQSELLRRFGIEVPIYHWPAAPRRLLRISAQAYNHAAQYEQLAAALQQLL